MLKGFFQWIFFFVIKFLNYINIFSRTKLKTIFLTILKWIKYYPLLLIGSYLFLSYVDYVLVYDFKKDQVNVESLWVSDYHKTLWEQNTFIYFLTFCVAANLAFFVYFFIPEHIRRLKQNRLIFITWIGCLIVEQNPVFCDLWYVLADKNIYFLVVNYWVIFWSNLMVQWAIEMDDDVDWKEEAEDHQRKMDDLPPIDRMLAEYKNKKISFFLDKLFTGAFGDSFESPQETINRYAAYKLRVRELLARDANAVIEEFDIEKPDPGIRGYRDIIRMMWMLQSGKKNITNFIANLKFFISGLGYAFKLSGALTTDIYNKIYHLIRIDFFCYIRTWIRRTKRILDYAILFYRLVAIFLFNIVKRKPRIYAIGPYEIQDPFYNIENLKQIFYGKETKSIKIQKPIRSLGTSKWNLAQKRLSISLFENKKIKK